MGVQGLRVLKVYYFMVGIGLKIYILIPYWV